MRRALGLLVGLALAAAGVLLGLYGLFALLYRGDNGGDGNTYVKWGGHRIDAHLVGGRRRADRVRLDRCGGFAPQARAAFRPTLLACGTKPRYQPPPKRPDLALSAAAERLMPRSS